MSLEERQEEIDDWYAGTAGVYSNLMAQVIPKNLRERFFSAINITKGSRVLEIGAGTGANFKYYPEGNEYFALEKNPDMLIYANSGAVTLVRGSIPDLPFKDDSFDYVIMTFVYSGIPYTKGLTTEAQRVLREEGKVGILDFDTATNGCGCVDHNLDRVLGSWSDFELNNLGIWEKSAFHGMQTKMGRMLELSK